jgi:hypothetical protein
MTAVTVKVRNSLYDIRHRYANGYIGPEFEEYTGTMIEEPWMGSEQFGLTTSDRRFPMRVLSRRNVVEIGGAKIAPLSISDDVVTKIYHSSTGSKYIVKKQNGSITCTCVGFSYRKSCKHVKQFDTLDTE